MKLRVLSGGAAQGLVAALAPQFEAETGCAIDGAFGAVGAMRDRLLAGEACDLLILTAALIAELTRSGHVREGAAAPVGVVKTAVAVRTGDAAPVVADAAQLRAALCAADAIYVPDPVLATAGIHVVKVLDALGVRTQLQARLRPFPNGATAMRMLAAAPERNPIGCTQLTEILNTPGVILAGPLPREFELATVYTAGVCSRAQRPDQARRLADLLAADASRAARERAGFEPPPPR